MLTNVGMKYYKFLNPEDEEPIIIRMIRIKNTELFVMQDEEGNKFKMTKKQLSEYTALTPDALLIFSIVGLRETTKDVIISMHRYKELLDGNNEPYAVCRQNIVNLFAQATNRSSVIYIGCSVSRDTCPPDVDFNVALACDAVTYHRKIVTYLDDTLNDILNLVPSTKYDQVLRTFYDYIDKSKFKGVVKSLRELMDSQSTDAVPTDFMNDYHRAFNIEEVSFKIDQGKQYNEEYSSYVLTPQQVEILEGILKVQVKANIVFKYDRNIDIDNITKAYVLICDITNTIYLVAYVPGHKINREYEAMEDHRDKELLENQISK